MLSIDMTVAEWLISPSRYLEKERILNILREQSEWITPTIQFDVCA